MITLYAVYMSYGSLFHFIWKMTRKQHLVFFCIFLSSFVWAIDAAFSPYILRVIIDTLTTHDLNRAAIWAFMHLPITCAISLWLMVEAGFRFQGFMLSKAIPKLESAIRMHLFDHIQNHSPKYFNEHFSGSLANKINDITSQIAYILEKLFALLVPSCAMCILAPLFLMRVNLVVALIFILWIVAYICIALLFSKKCDTYEKQHAESRSALIGKIVDSLTNNFAVNLFYGFGYEKRRVLLFQAEELKKNRFAKLYVEKMRLLMSIIFLTCAISLNGLALYFWINNKLTTGEVAQIFNTMYGTITVLWMMVSVIPSLFQSVGVAKQGLSVLNDPQDILDKPGSFPIHVKKGEILFDKVCFSYGEKGLFHNKDVHIPGGQKVGLVGYSGSGKSTFINLILRLYSVNRGKILIDNQPIEEITLESLRKQVALIPQDPLLFHRSLEENIHFGNPNASQEDVLRVAKLAHCEEFINRLPQGYQSIVGERGTKLSGGERQRIAIARALLSDAPILILDEATSALDSVTETYIQENLEGLMQNKTTLVIAHRLSTLSKMDRLLVFDQGKIIEDGTHNALLAKKGHYATMWQMQAGGFLPL